MSSENDVRRLALDLPGVEERPAYGTSAFYAGPKMFARLHEQPGVLVCWRADLGEREALLQEDPDTYFTTDHYDGHPSVLVRLERVSPARLGELLRDAWEARAPQRLRRATPSE
ncbi:MmcQ/YjbR family DNA-binding protein [Microbacterium proteolyticum]|uniref:MmcQ/YjbR family DNA-binding protein n=1 Tax=Microbacterium proteolyticum TaxID=1572644 RepID=UPI001FACC59B|nr:MmcQ/YjbR family DNA-binding protein [Microbacterium proteolyticum]